MIDTLQQFAQALEPLSKFPLGQFLIAFLAWRAVRLIVFSVPRAEFLREIERLESEHKRESKRMETEYLRLGRFLLIGQNKLAMRLAKLEE